MGSHTVLPGGIKLTLGKGGIRFTKKATRFNNCIGDKMRGQKYSGRGDVKAKFKAAANACK